VSLERSKVSACLPLLRSAAQKKIELLFQIANHRFAIRIDSVSLKHSFGEINADGANLRGGRPHVALFTTPRYGTSMPLSRGVR